MPKRTVGLSESSPVHAPGVTVARRKTLNSENPLDSLGGHLRELRTSRGLTLEQVSERSDVSVGMLSQIERGLSNPSFLTLFKIARGLEVPVSRFFSGLGSSSKVVRKHERKKLVSVINGSRSGARELTYELLSPDLSGSLELLWIEYGPEASTEAADFSHEGEECGVVLEGRLQVHVADDVFLLEAGDSVYLESSVPHWFRNPDEETAVLVWAITPPSF